MNFYKILLDKKYFWTFEKPRIELHKGNRQRKSKFSPRRQIAFGVCGPYLIAF